MKTKITWFDRMMAAVTFAEANEPAKGIEFLAAAKKAEKKEVCRDCENILTTDLHGAEVR